MPAQAHPGDLPRSASAVRVEGDGVVVTALKQAERGEALVVRVCEVAGGRTTARVIPARRARSAARCDLLERPRETLSLDPEGGVSVALTPFQFATLRFEP